MCRGAAALAWVLGATSGPAGFIARVNLFSAIATMRTPSALNAILALRPVLPTRPAALVEFLESMDYLSEGIRRRPDGVGEAAFKTVLAHLLLFGIRSASETSAGLTL